MLVENGHGVVEVVIEVALGNDQTICEVVEIDGVFALEEENEAFWESDPATCDAQ